MNLRDVVRQVLDESDVTDPRDLAVLVDERVSSREVREAFRFLLPIYVREVIRTERGTAPVPEDVQAGVNGKRELGAMTSDPWRARTWVPGVGWKLYGDLTAEDLDLQAEDYERRAGEMESHAKGCRLLAQRMREAKAKRLRDLSADVLAEVAA